MWTKEQREKYRPRVDRDNEKLHRVWQHMHKRIDDPTGPKNACYQNKKVCPEWFGKAGWKAFRCWAIANGWRAGLQIDRRDNHGDYTPENCRFVTRIENANNKESNVRFCIGGISRTKAEWSRQPGAASETTITARMKLGWDTEKAVFGSLREAPMYLLNGHAKTLADLARIAGAKKAFGDPIYKRIESRIRRGWPAHHAVYGRPEKSLILQNTG